jgi:hypothetical protein
VNRLRALAAAALVTVVVFYALAAPLLREWLGPFVVVPAYVAVALLAGVVTYRAVLVLSKLADRTEDEEDLEGDVDAESLEDLVGDDDLEEADLEELAGEADLDRADVEAVLGADDTGGEHGGENGESDRGDGEAERER